MVLRKFDPTSWLRLVKEHRVTDTFTAPTQLKRIVALPPGELARADLSSMRTLIANAAPVPYALKQEVIEKLGDGFLYEVYGSTELGVVTVLHPEDQLRKPGSCGRTYGPIEVRIVRDDGTERRGGGAGRALHPHDAGDGRLPPHRRAALRARRRRLEVGRRRRLPRRRGLPLHLRPQEGHDHLRRGEHLPRRDRGGDPRAPGDPRRRGVRHPRRRVGRAGARDRATARRRRPSISTSCARSSTRASAATSGHATTRCATSCRAPSRASCSSVCCGTSTGAIARPRSEPPDGFDALRA